MFKNDINIFLCVNQCQFKSFDNMGSKGKMKSMPRTGKNKGKRWKKGHSSTSNPESNRFREAAKNRFFSANTGISAGLRNA